MSLDAVRDWSTNATLNTTLGPSLTLDGTVMKPSDVDNAFREMMAQVAVQFGKVNFKGTNIASAATTNLANATGNFVDITGTTTITGLGTVAAGQLFFLRFTGALTFTHNATSLILPGAANITTANGDVACMLSLGAGNWVCAGYQRAGGGTIGVGSSTDNTVPRFDGAAGKLQSSGVVISDTDAVSGIVGLTVTGGGSLTGTWTDLGTVSTIDINGGTVDGATIGGTSAGAITGTTITATGQLVISGAGAGQIVFPASQNASANANTFDDYEEGTFTPTIVGGSSAGTGTYVTQIGRYTKFGNLVTYSINLDWSAHTGTGTIAIGGLPFTALGGGPHSVATTWWIRWAFAPGGAPLIGRVVPNTTTIAISTVQTASTVNATIDTDASVFVSGSYFTA